MSLTQEAKTELIDNYKTHDGDTGSPEVQIALLSADIKQLTEHMKVHKKDFHSRRGLLQKVSRRNKLLAYLNRKHHDRYVAVTQALGLRR